MDNSTYTFIIREDTLEFRIQKDGKELPFQDCLNVLWGMQSALATVKRTEAEVKRRESL